jgi:hypothetical protein
MQDGRRFPGAFDKPQREALAMLFLRLHNHGVLVNEVFWGLWLFPFGLLVYRSRVWQQSDTPAGW